MRSAIINSLVLIAVVLFAAFANAAAPAVEVIAPNGGEAITGNYEIDFNVSDADNNRLFADIYYSQVQGDFNNLIVSRLNLEGSACFDSDRNNVTENACSYVWNAATVLDGAYYIDINVYENPAHGNWESATDSSDGSFKIDHTFPALDDFKPKDANFVNNPSQEISVRFTDEGGHASGIDRDSIRFLLFGFRATYSEGDSLTGMIGAGEYLDEAISAELVDVVVNGPPMRFEAVFDVRDGQGELIDTVRLMEGEFLNERVLSEDGSQIIVNSIEIEAINRNGDVNVSIDGVVYDINNSELSYKGSDADGRIVYNPSHPIRSDLVQPIVPLVLATDKAGNFTVAFWAFVFENKEVEIAAVSPEADSYVSDVNTPVLFAFKDVANPYVDPAAGIDFESVEVRVNGVTYTPYDEEINIETLNQPTGLLGNGAYAGVIRFTPSSSFPEGSNTVTARIKDRAGNVSTATTNFIVDTAPVSISGISPEGQSYTNERNTDINFTLNDSASGVNFSSMELSVNDVNYNVDSSQVRYNEDTGEVVFSPSARFRNNSVVSVVVRIDDNIHVAGNEANSVVYDWNFTVDAAAANAVDDLNAESDEYGNTVLDWDAPDYINAPVVSYNIYRSEMPINELDASEFEAAYTGSTATDFTDERVEVGDYYYYRISSIDAAGNESVLSNSARVYVEQNMMLGFDYNEVALLPGETINVQLQVDNQLGERKCVEFYPYVRDYQQLEAKIMVEDICMNANERTQITMSVTAFENATPGVYYIDVEMDFEGVEKVQRVEIVILGSEEIDFSSIPTGVSFCLGGYEKVVQGIVVTNNTNEMKEVVLTAESQLFLPVFEPAMVRLQVGESREVPLVLHTNYTTKAGEYVIPIFVRTDNYYTEREVRVWLRDCTVDGPLGIFGPDSCASVSKGRSNDIEVQVVNNLDKAQTVRLSAVSDIVSDFIDREITLAANSSETVYVRVRGREQDDTGRRDVKIYAWSSEGEAEDEICARVNKEHGVSIAVPDDLGQAIACSAEELEVVPITVSNNGDYTERMKLYVENVPSSIDADLSESEVTIDAGESETVYLAIVPAYDTPLGVKKVYIRASPVSGGSVRKAFEFRVVSPALGLEEGVIELINYPQEIVIEKGESKRITFSVRNTKNVSVSGIRVKLWGLNSKTYFPTVYLDRLGPGESVTKTGILNVDGSADAGRIELTLEAKSDDYISAQDVLLRVKEKASEEDYSDEDNGEDAGIIGLFGLFASSFGGPFVVGGIILIVFAIILLLLLKSGKNKHKVNGEPWVNYHKNTGV